MAAARLIDLTRLASRIGLGQPTGIDRVERAWADHLLTLPDPLFALVRMKLGFALLDRGGIGALLSLVDGRRALGPSDLLGRILWRGAPHRARAEADLRRIAISRVPPWRLAWQLRRLGPGFEYFNLGHANLTMSGLKAVKSAGGRVSVLLHDTIPLDFPQYTRDGISAVFTRKLAAVSAHADRVVHTAHAARQASEAQLAKLGRVPPGLVANLGVTRLVPDDTLLPKGLDLGLPFVLALGTIEPRKNLSLLCDIWTAAADLPQLYIVGNRGWAAAEEFERLQRTNGIHLLGALPDGAVAALMDRALALVFPSHAEGFGLPPIEAAARGLPILCSDLPVLHELLRELPVYLKPTDVYAWTKAIQTLGKTGVRQSDKDRATAGSEFVLPSWEAHFNLILNHPAQNP